MFLRTYILGSLILLSIANALCAQSESRRSAWGKWAQANSDQREAGATTDASSTLASDSWAMDHFAQPTVSIPTAIPAAFGDPVEVPIEFAGNGLSISSAVFSIDYDELCFRFDPAEVGNVTFSLPEGFTGKVFFDESDSLGELDVVILASDPPLGSLPDSIVATLTLKTGCEPIYTSVITAVGFSDVPPPSFADTWGIDIPGTATDGSIEVLPGTRGDCDADGFLSSDDLSACVLEIFDDDGDFWGKASGGNFVGNPVGCDANADATIDAGDLSCENLLIFQGSGACNPPMARRFGWSPPALSMGRALPSHSLGSLLAVPIHLQTWGWEINSVIFSVDYDSRVYAFDSSDQDGDGIPDAIRFDLPASAHFEVSFDPADTDGEIDISILDPFQVLARDLGTTLLTLMLEPIAPSSDATTGVAFSRNPTASFGDLSGQRVEGLTRSHRLRK